MYYELTENYELYKRSAHIGKYPDLPRGVQFKMGRRIAQSLPTPLRFELSPRHGPELTLLMGVQVLLMRKDLIAALREVGVDNLDTYDAVIYNPFTKSDVHDYQAVNIIGLVSAADLGASEYESFGEEPHIDTVFMRTAIDERRTGGALMFRMEESISTIMVHDRVKDHLAPRFPTLDFIPAGGAQAGAGPEEEEEEEEEEIEFEDED